MKMFIGDKEIKGIANFSFKVGNFPEIEYTQSEVEEYLRKMRGEVCNEVADPEETEPPRG